MAVEISYGWVIQDQAPVIQGMSFGPGWLRGKKRTGPLMSGMAHNLIGKDVLFHGKGKGALDAIVAHMKTLTRTKIRCGIYPGMMIEKFEDSEYGGGMDEVRVMATEKDITRVPYYVYAFEEEKSDYAFSSLVTSFVSRATGFIPSSGIAETVRDLMDTAQTIHGQVSNMLPEKKDIAKAKKASQVFVLLTSRQQSGRAALARHSHTHTLPTLAKDIETAMATV